MNIIKTHKHISDNTGISNGKKHSWGGGGQGGVTIKGQHNGVPMW